MAVAQKTGTKKTTGKWKHGPKLVACPSDRLIWSHTHFDVLHLFETQVKPRAQSLALSLVTAERGIWIPNLGPEEMDLWRRKHHLLPKGHGQSCTHKIRSPLVLRLRGSRVRIAFGCVFLEGTLFCFFRLFFSGPGGGGVEGKPKRKRAIVVGSNQKDNKKRKRTRPELLASPVPRAVRAPLPGTGERRSRTKTRAGPTSKTKVSGAALRGSSVLWVRPPKKVGHLSVLPRCVSTPLVCHLSVLLPAQRMLFECSRFLGGPPCFVFKREAKRRTEAIFGHLPILRMVATSCSHLRNLGFGGFPPVNIGKQRFQPWFQSGAGFRPSTLWVCPSLGLSPWETINSDRSLKERWMNRMG